jgi:hypothetical protein
VVLRLRSLKSQFNMLIIETQLKSLCLKNKEETEIKMVSENIVIVIF